VEIIWQLVISTSLKSIGKEKQKQKEGEAMKKGRKCMKLEVDPSVQWNFHIRFCLLMFRHPNPMNL
jgi:hypothetical protein